MIDLDQVPYIGAAHQSRRPEPITLIVLHSGETNEGNTAAEGMAAYFASGNTIGSAHVCCDNDSVVRCAPDENRTNGAGGVNNFALHIEQAGRAGQLAEEWADPYSSAVVAHAAGVTQFWLGRHPRLQPVYLDAGALARGERYGITTHAQVSQVFAGNDGHWDPGPYYPMTAFLDIVRGTTPEDPVARSISSFLIQEPGSPAIWLYDPESNTKTAFPTAAAKDAWAMVSLANGGDTGVHSEPWALELLAQAVDLRAPVA